MTIKLIVIVCNVAALASLSPDLGYNATFLLLQNTWKLIELISSIMSSVAQFTRYKDAKFLVSLPHSNAAIKWIFRIITICTGLRKQFTTIL